ncbi:hypothetical protein SBA4_4210001 [Candidatus Sulfopaludibacter sp. SbA4]|nr:hypothetical protein SBA4_4210001 [Candidatus Sulfopaludibacter sp. SbA4]
MTHTVKTTLRMRHKISTSLRNQLKQQNLKPKK